MNRIKLFFLILAFFIAINVNAQKNELGCIQLPNANTSMTVDINRGGRISSLKINGIELLYLDTITNNWGSTFWPSPQALWNWPPPANLDKNPFSVSKGKRKLILKSKIDELTHLSINKEFMVSKKDTSFIIRYTMVNHDTVVRKFAPWEITRVPTKGFVFAARKSHENDYLWFDLNESYDKKSKVNHDGEGWLAYVSNDGYIFIKTYSNISPLETAPDEGEFEYYRDKNIYIELENQGKYEAVKPSHSLSWDVKWYVRKLPNHIKPVFKNKQLIDYVYQIILQNLKQKKRVSSHYL